MLHCIVYLINRPSALGAQEGMRQANEQSGAEA